MRFALPALCGLMLLSTFVATPSRAQELPDIDPTAAVMKAVSPDAAQKKKLEALSAASQKKGEAALDTLGPMIEKRIEAASNTPEFQAKAAEIAKLPEAEQKAAMDKLTAGLIDQIRPELEKSIFGKMRGVLVEFFDGAAKLMKPAQKPKLAKARTAYFQKFDKDVPAAIKSLIDAAAKGE